MPSASNSWAREKLASAIFDLASASAPSCGSLSRSVATRLTSAAWRAWSSRIAAWRAIDMRHLVRQHRGDFGLVVGERDQAARDVELAVRQREGVDRGRVQDRDLVAQVRPLGGGDQLVDGLVQHRLDARVVVVPAIGREDAHVLALPRRRQRARRCWRMAGARRRLHRRNARGRAGGQRKLSAPSAASASRSRANGAARAAARRDGHDAMWPTRSITDRAPAISIWSGCIASIHGPPRSSIVPLTLTRWPSASLTAGPRPRNVRSLRFSAVTVKSSVQRRPKLT